MSSSIIRRLLPPVAASLLLTVPVFGDQVTMKNGDRLSGKIVRFDGKLLQLKAEFAGDVAIPWEAITSLTSTEPINVLLKDGQKVVGSITTTGNEMSVKTADAGTVTTTLAAVQGIRSQAEEAAYEAELERLRNPRMLDLWKGYVEAGLATAQGNAETTTMNLGMNATRTSPRDKINTYFTSLYATNSTTGERITTANAIRGGVKYDVNVNERLFGFGFTDLEYDQFQNLDLRFVPGAGLGYHAIKNERTMLDFSVGGSLNREFFSTGLRRTSGEALVGNELTFQLTKGTGIQQKFVLYPNLTERGAYRMNFDIAGVTTLNRWLSWQVSLSDRYLSNPVPGRQKNDVLFTTGLRVTFAKEPAQ